MEIKQAFEVDPGLIFYGAAPKFLKLAVTYFRCYLKLGLVFTKCTVTRNLTPIGPYYSVDITYCINTVDDEKIKQAANLCGLQFGDHRPDQNFINLKMFGDALDGAIFLKHTIGLPEEALNTLLYFEGYLSKETSIQSPIVVLPSSLTANREQEAIYFRFLGLDLEFVLHKWEQFLKSRTYQAYKVVQTMDQHISKGLDWLVFKVSTNQHKALVSAVTYPALEKSPTFTKKETTESVQDQVVNEMMRAIDFDKLLEIISKELKRHASNGKKGALLKLVNTGALLMLVRRPSIFPQQIYIENVWIDIPCDSKTLERIRYNLSDWENTVIMKILMEKIIDVIHKDIPFVNRSKLWSDALQWKWAVI